MSDEDDVVWNEDTKGYKKRLPLGTTGWIFAVLFTIGFIYWFVSTMPLYVTLAMLLMIGLVISLIYILIRVFATRAVLFVIFRVALFFLFCVLDDGYYSHR